jgi:hypothetical protein
MEVEQQLCERGRDQECEKSEKRAPFIGEEGQPQGGGVRQSQGEILLLFICLFMVVTSSST